MAFCGLPSGAVECVGLGLVTRLAQGLHVVDGVSATSCQLDDVINISCPVTTHQA
jgi:hypothetical protein